LLQIAALKLATVGLAPEAWNQSNDFGIHNYNASVVIG
jgi:hypothetical protein